MLWLLRLIIKFIVARIQTKQLMNKQINHKYSWALCHSCQTQLNDDILRYNDQSFCKSCHDECVHFPKTDENYFLN